MNWTINPVVTVNGTNYTADALDGITINYGRNDIWEQPRASYATIQILNTTNSVFADKVTDPVVIQVDDSAGNPVTIFTGKLSSISTSVRAAGSQATVVIHTLIAIGPMADMSRIITHTSAWPKEYDDDRLSRILTDSGVTIDVVDTPGVYEFTAISAQPADCWTKAAYYAQMGFGYIYETTDGKVGYANESRRLVDKNANGFLTIPNDVILSNSVNSDINLNNLLNDIRLEYKNSQITTATNASSITTYGSRAADIKTELEQQVQAEFQAQRYIDLRSTPQSVLRSFTVQLDAPDMTAGLLDDLLAIYMGLPIELASLPTGIHSGIFEGFVEGWQIILSRAQASLVVTATEKFLSITPTRWQDVVATLQWEDVTPTLEWADYE